MKTRLVTLLLASLAVITLATGCNGANDITGPQNPRQGGSGDNPPPQTVTPHPRPTPNPCRQNPWDCD